MELPRFVTQIKMCAIKKCRNRDYDLIYLHKRVCDRCWHKYADDRDKLREMLGIGEKVDES